MKLPSSVQLEVTTRCNGGCLFCVQRAAIAPADMAWETFEACLPLIGEGCRVALYGNGEPLMHARFLDMVRAVRERGARAMTSTNGSLVPIVGAEALAQAGLQEIVFSIADVAPDVHERLQPGVRAPLVWSALARCAKAGIFTVALLIVRRDNYERAPVFAAKAIRHGARHLIMHELVLPPTHPLSGLLLRDPNEARRAMGQTERLARLYAVGVERRGANLL